MFGRRFSAFGEVLLGNLDDDDRWRFCGDGAVKVAETGAGGTPAEALYNLAEKLRRQDHFGR